MESAARITALFAFARGKSRSSETSVWLVYLAPNRVRVLSRDAIVSAMPLKSNSRGVRQVECDLSGRAPDEGARLH